MEIVEKREQSRECPNNGTLAGWLAGWPSCCCCCCCAWCSALLLFLLLLLAPLQAKKDFI